MNLPTDYDYFSCFLDLLTYQKTEITDCISILLDTKIPLLEEGLLLCTFKMPSSNYDFKMYIRKICHDPMVLEKFTLEIENDNLVIIRCHIKYDTYSVLSEPLFKFPFKEFKNLSNLQTQLNTLTFSYKVLKSHLFFQVMQLNGAVTKIEFHYNATRDCFATSPSGHNYAMFIDRHGNKITSVKAQYAVQNTATFSVPAPGPPRPFPQPPPPTQPSIPLAAALASTAAFTPHRTYAGSHNETDRRDTARRHIFGDPNVLLRSRHSSDTVKDDTKTTRLCRTNMKIIKEIAASEKFTCDTDLIEEMFHTRTSNAWNISRYGILDLALRGVIPITDNRISLDDIQGGDVEANETSEVVNEKDIPKETT